MSFKIGDKVSWTSQSAGITRVKHGEVIHIVPPGERPPSMVGTGIARKHESYVVRAIADNGSGRSRLYWPHVSKLTHTVPAADERQINVAAPVNESNGG